MNKAIKVLCVSYLITLKSCDRFVVRRLVLACLSLKDSVFGISDACKVVSISFKLKRTLCKYI